MREFKCGKCGGEFAVKEKWASSALRCPVYFCEGVVVDALAEAEQCPSCKREDFAVARNVLATRMCKCGKTWQKGVGK